MLDDLTRATYRIAGRLVPVLRRFGYQAQYYHANERRFDGQRDEWDGIITWSEAMHAALGEYPRLCETLEGLRGSVDSLPDRIAKQKSRDEASDIWRRS